MSCCRFPVPQNLRDQLPCQGCLGPLDRASEAGLCGRCWEGLESLPEERCPRCALVHDLANACPETIAWSLGDALWNYHGGRPPLGALLLPAIKSGELAWRYALLHRASQTGLPGLTAKVDLVTAAPTAFYRRWLRGFDVAEDFARQVADRLDRPFIRTLRRTGSFRRQAKRTESERRRLPRKSFSLRSGIDLRDRVVLLVDDVWTTGTTLLRCAQSLADSGAADVRVLTIFRAL
jgi:predicted amidophosphoribosyltransferase